MSKANIIHSSHVLAALPALWLIYDPQPSGKDSGSVHSTVKERWERGDETVRCARMRRRCSK